MLQNVDVETTEYYKLLEWTANISTDYFANRNLWDKGAVDVSCHKVYKNVNVN